MNSDKPDPLSAMPSWRLVVLLVACLAAIASSGYLVLAALMSWRGLGWSAGVFVAAGAAATFIAPRGTWAWRK